MLNKIFAAFICMNFLYFFFTNHSSWKIIFIIISSDLKTKTYKVCKQMNIRISAMAHLTLTCRDSNELISPRCESEELVTTTHSFHHSTLTQHWDTIPPPCSLMLQAHVCIVPVNLILAKAVVCILYRTLLRFLHNRTRLNSLSPKRRVGR